jgi:predicted ester cyclase
MSRLTPAASRVPDPAVTFPASSGTVVQRLVDEVMNGGRPAAAGEIIENEPLRQRIAAFRSAFTDLHVTIERAVVDGPLVAVHLIAQGIHTGAVQGGDPTGRRWSSSCTAIFEVRDGRIVDFWMTWNMLDILEQLGLVRRAAGISA